MQLYGNSKTASGDNRRPVAIGVEIFDCRRDPLGPERTEMRLGEEENSKVERNSMKDFKFTDY